MLLAGASHTSCIWGTEGQLVKKAEWGKGGAEEPLKDSALETAADRLKMLRGKILPHLSLLNTGILEEAWKAHKLVSVLHDRELNRVLTDETAN